MSRPATAHGRRDALEGAHRSIVHLEVALRDVDRDDLHVYLALDDPRYLREYVEGLASVEYEKREGSGWAN